MTGVFASVFCSRADGGRDCFSDIDADAIIDVSDVSRSDDTIHALGYHLLL